MDIDIDIDIDIDVDIDVDTDIEIDREYGNIDLDMLVPGDCVFKRLQGVTLHCSFFQSERYSYVYSYVYSLLGNDTISLY